MYVTDIAGTRDSNSLYAVDLEYNTVLGNVTGITATPHNIVISKEKIFATHLGSTNNKVLVYSASANALVLVFEKDVTAEDNPFGLAYIEPKCV